MDSDDQRLLSETLRRTMASASGPELDRALDDLGWRELLADYPDIAIRLVFGLLGETGAHASILNDVIAGDPAADAVPATVALPFARGRYVEWTRDEGAGQGSIDPGLPLREVPGGSEIPLTRARIALGWWLTGASRAMLDMARTHALTRTQFGRPIAAFQAVRHRLAETRVAIDGAEATLLAAHDDLSALLAKAAAGQAALITSRHAQQILGGIGFTAEHDFHRFANRILVLDSLLGSARDLTRLAGERIREEGSAIRVVDL